MSWTVTVILMWGTAAAVVVFLVFIVGAVIVEARRRRAELEAKDNILPEFWHLAPSDSRRTDTDREGQ